MSLREFTDGEGRRWQVWETIPETPSEERAFRQNAQLLAAGSRFSAGREAGWLTFQTGTEKRRLSPIPPGWAESSDAELARYAERAERAVLTEAAARVLAQAAGAQPPDESRPA